MAEENTTQEAEAQSAKSGGGGGMLPALLVILLMPVISFAMFKFLFLPEIIKHVPDAAAAAAEHGEEIDPSKIHVVSGEKYLKDFPDLIVNISGVSMTRFLRVNFTIESQNPEIDAMVEKNMPAMRDLANTVLRHLTLADLERPNIMDTVRNQLKQGFDQVLQPPMIDEIYFTQFVVQ